MTSAATGDSNNQHARLAVLLLALIWGLNWPAVKLALGGIAPWTMRAFALALGALALYGLARLRRRSLQVPQDKWRALVIAGLLNIAGFNVLMAFAQLFTTASRAVIVAYTMPLWATLFAWIFLREVPGRYQTAGLILGMSGLAILLLPLLNTTGIPVGVLFALAGALSWAAGTVYLKHAQIIAEPLALALWQLIIGALAAAIGMLLFEGVPQWHALPATAVAGFTYQVVCGMALAYFLWFEVVSKLPAGVATLGILGVPVVGVVSSSLLLGERPGLADIVGFVLIFSAAMTVLLPAPRTKTR
jgi:drug/metabolite transporter (DMT)-like permease